MAESAPPTPIPTAPAIDRLVIRPWPKIILMIPTLIVALIAGVVTRYADVPPPEADFSTVHAIGLCFLFVLLINLTMLLYDLSLRGFLIVALLLLVLILAIFLLDRADRAIWNRIAGILGRKVYANSSFYFLFSFVLLFNLLIAWVITRFHYWKVEHNEIIINRGFMHEQERHPTAQARFKLVIDDVVEYGMLGCGKLVFYFGDDKTEHTLETVLFVRSKAKVLDELLGRVAVIQK